MNSRRKPSPNRVPADRSTIRLPVVAPGDPGDRWRAVTGRSPTVDKRAAILAAYMFKREARYDFPFVTDPSDFTSGRLFAACLTDSAHEHFDGWVPAPWWVLCRRRPDGTVDIGVMWAHPHHRHRGVMTSTWAQLCAVLGDESPWVDPPWSAATRALLSAVGHTQPPPDRRPEQETTR